MKQQNRETPANTMMTTVSDWISEHSVTLLRISLAVVFLWFGSLKLFPGASPAEDLAGDTLGELTMGAFPHDTLVRFLGVWECAIGCGLLFGAFLRTTLALLFTQMIGTFTPLVLFPHQAFNTIPYAPTIVGQYIIKNLVLISAGLVIASAMIRERRAARA